MTVKLPRNYNRKRGFPFVVFLWKHDHGKF